MTLTDAAINLVDALDTATRAECEAAERALKLISTNQATPSFERHTARIVRAVIRQWLKEY